VLPQPWLHRRCRRPGLLQAPTMSLLCEFLPLLCPYVNCVGGLASEPGMLVYCSCACA
jgi:hypothetical protein